MESIKNVKRGNSISHCKCIKTEFKNGLYICSHAKEWLRLVEQNTDMPIDFEYSQIFYERVQKKPLKEEDEMQIDLDVPRTYPENKFFGSEGFGRSTLKVILKTLCKHSSSTGYTQGMNFIVASLFYHCGEVLAFEMTIRALNDYHLKAIYMSQLPGLIFHCKVL